MTNQHYYQLALASGLNEAQAKLFATAMTHQDKPNINHLIIK